MTLKYGLEYYQRQLELTHIIQKANNATRKKKQAATGRYLPEVVLDTSYLESKIEQLSELTAPILTDTVSQKLKAIQEEQLMSTSFSSDCVVFPYYTDEAKGLTVTMETHETSPRRNNMIFSVYDLMSNYLDVLMKSQPDFVSGCYTDLAPERVKVVLRYPIITENDITSLAFYSEEHFDSETMEITYVISDFILYDIIMTTLSGDSDYAKTSLEFVMSELYEMPETVPMVTIDKHFSQLAKFAYVTRILEKNTDVFGNCDFPLLRFSVGSYKLKYAMKSDVMNVQQNDSLVLNFRNWQNILSASFMVSHDAEEIVWVDDPTAYIHNLIPITGVGFQKQITGTSATLCSPFELIPKLDKGNNNYYSNVLIRNKALEHLNGKKDYYQKRNQIFSKTRGYGAVHKLNDLFATLGLQFSNFSKIFEYGVAPGTWLKGFLQQHPNFQYYHGITPFSQGNLKMDNDVLELLGSKVFSNKVLLLDSKAEDYTHTTCYDLILSDAAFDVGNKYELQSQLHEEMFIFILCNSMKALLPGGTIICKIYDLTPELHKLIDHIHDRFDFITILKPPSSHPLNSEQYLILHKFTGQCNVKRYLLDAEFNLSIQFDSIKRFLSKAYAIHLTHYLNNDFLNVRIIDNQFPTYIAVPLHLLSLAPDLFKTVSSGKITMLISPNGDEELHLDWDAPMHPMAQEFYPLQTIIRYRSRGISLSIPLMYTKLLYLEEYGKSPHIYYYLHKESSFILNEVSNHDQGIIIGPEKPTHRVLTSDIFVNASYIHTKFNVAYDIFLHQYPLETYVRGLSFFRLSQKTSFLRNLCRARSHMAQNNQLGTRAQSIDIRDRVVLSKIIKDYEIASRQGPNRAFKFLYHFNRAYAVASNFFKQDHTSLFSASQTYTEHTTNKRFPAQSYCYEFRRIIAYEQKRATYASQRYVRT